MLQTLIKILEAFRPSRPQKEADAEMLLATLEHAKRGYATAQETIKLLDTKTGLITGLSTLLSGFMVAWGKWSLESTISSPANLIEVARGSRFFGALLCVFLGTTFIATFLCILWSIWTVVARSRPKHLNERFVVLFPQYAKAEEVAACGAFEKKLKGMQMHEILSEYEDQLRVVGMILGKKLAAHRRAALALIVQVACIVLTMIAIALAQLLSR